MLKFTRIEEEDAFEGKDIYAGGPLFQLFSSNPYALSNNTRMSILLKDKGLNVAHSGIEKIIKKEASMVRFDDKKEGELEKHLEQQHEIVNFESVNLAKHNYARPKFVAFLEHLIVNLDNQIFRYEPPFKGW